MTREHRTFRIKTQSRNAHFAPGTRIVSLLISPEQYQNFAFINDDGIHVWRKFSGIGSELFRQTKVWTNWDWFGLMLWHIATKTPSDKFDINRYKLFHEGRCLVCNRVLTTPDSILRGIGPVCAASLQ